MANEDSSTTANLTPTIAASNPTLPPVQIHHLISVKLDNSNYLLWRTQFLPLLKGYELEGFVDGSNKCPAETLTNNTINPEYIAWNKQDQILLGWLLSSLTESALAHVVGLQTSQAVWEALSKHFASKAQSRILYLKRELQNVKRRIQNHS